MVAALDLLASLPGRRVAVLGEMLELGDLSDEAHRAVGAHAARAAQLLVAVGPSAPLYAAGARAAGMDAAAIVEARDRMARWTCCAPAAAGRRGPAQGVARRRARPARRRAAPPRGARRPTPEPVR